MRMMRSRSSGLFSSASTDEASETMTIEAGRTPGAAIVVEASSALSETTSTPVPVMGPSLTSTPFARAMIRCAVALNQIQPSARPEGSPPSAPSTAPCANVGLPVLRSILIAS